MSAMVGGAFGDAVAARSGSAAVTRPTRPRRGHDDGHPDAHHRSTKTAPANGVTRAVRRLALVLGVGGLLMAVGGALHPHETSAPSTRAFSRSSGPRPGCRHTPC